MQVLLHADRTIPCSMLFSFVCLIETGNNETKFVIFGKDVCDVNFDIFNISYSTMVG